MVTELSSCSRCRWDGTAVRQSRVLPLQPRGKGEGSGIGCGVGCGIRCGISLRDQLCDQPATHHLCPPAAVLQRAFPVPTFCSLQTSSNKGITGLSVKSPCLGCSVTLFVSLLSSSLLLSITVRRVWLLLMFSGDFLYIQKRLMWTRTDRSIVSNEQMVL